MFRSLVLSLAENEVIGNFVRRKGMATGFARRFVAGEGLAEAIQVVRGLNESNILASLDFLGESVVDADEARKAAGNYLQSLDSIKDRKSTRLNSSHIQKSRMPSSA